MSRATITIHLPSHRRESIRSYGESWRMLDQVYDSHIGHYLEFLRRQGRELGFEVRTDNKELDPVYSINERDHEDKKKAREWLNAVPDLWEWLT